ncbi:MAG: PKD domain-containing protein [Saprospiraceae bacterium]
MNTAQKQALTCAFFFVSLNILYSQQQIVGPLDVCGGCHEYTLAFEATGEERYEWVVGVDDFFFNVGTSKNVFICWDQFLLNGSNSPSVLNLNVTVTGGLTNGFSLGAEINIQNPTSITIVPIDAPPCYALPDAPADSISCQKVCAHTIVTYTIDATTAPGGTLGELNWEVSGEESFDIDTARNTITVNWGQSGFGQLFAFYFSNGCESFASACVEIIDLPKASFTAHPPPEHNELTICKGQTVFFQNNSQNAERYAWQFGNLGTSIVTDPTFLFPSAGSYTVELLAYNACSCVDTARMLIKVLDTESPSLDCIGTVCAGETVRYTTNQGCGQYDWSLSANGRIVEGGGINDDFIVINWEEGADLGTIELVVADCAGLTTCTEPSIFQIPILSAQAQIQGPPIICDSAVETYQIAPFSGTTFSWQTSNGGEIIGGQGTNEVVVDWRNAGTTNPQWIAVQYEHCFLGCGGADTLEVLIQPSFRIEGPIEVCQNETATFSAFNNRNNVTLPAHWGIVNNLGDTLWQSPATTATPDIAWPFSPGFYTLYAAPADPTAVCLKSTEQRVRIIAPPSAPLAISGDTIICPGLFYSYRLDDGGGFDYEWDITDGANQSIKSGQSIIVAWGPSPPYILRLTRINRNGPSCRSTPLEQHISTLGPLEIIGDTQACIGMISTYASSLSSSTITPRWSIAPAHAGTLIGDPSAPSIEVLWHTEGPAELHLAACGQSTSRTISIKGLPQPTLNLPAAICESTIATIGVAESFATYIWQDDAGAVIGNGASIEIGAGAFLLSVTDDFGCTQDTAFTVERLATPIIGISTPDFTRFCNTAVSARLYALEGSQGYQYQWYRDGVPVGTNSPFLDANAVGAYLVEATALNGCSSASNVIALIENCDGGPGGGGGGGGANCPAGANPAISVIASPMCNERTYESLSSGMVAGSANWFFDDPESGVANTATADQPTHQYTKAGYYRVVLNGTFSGNTGAGSCLISIVDTIPAAADFDVMGVCSGQPIAFTNLSTFLPGEAITDWFWDFGDPASGVGNSSGEENPSHTYAVGGTYTVTLTLTAASGCQSILSKDIVVLPPPAFDLIVSSATCEELALPFEVNTTAILTRIYWDFDDPSSGDANILEGDLVYHQYDASGTYNIGVRVEDIYGCSHTLSQPFAVSMNDLNGDISSTLPSPICEGDSTQLSAPPGGINWVWSNEANTAQIWVKEGGVYGLTMEDINGCTYQPAPLLIDFTPSPSSFIRAAERNENGQVVAYHYDHFEACYGSDVQLEANGNLSYTFSWSDGTNGPILSFTKVTGNLLNPGEYDFFLNVKDNNTQCSTMIGPFKVTIHPQPGLPTILSSVISPICPGQNAVLSLSNPDPNLIYSWNTGETGTSIIANTGGRYVIKANNAFGCTSQSNSIDVLEGPNIDLFPSGCHSRCKPDTICLPTLPDIVQIQWFKDGVAIPGAEGMAQTLPITESGSYWLNMKDVNGCQLETERLELELFDGFGDIGGQVFYDVNENGVIDGSDTLVNGIGVQLWQDGLLQQTRLSDQDGTYVFEGIAGGDYALFLDTLNLPANMMAEQIQQDTSIVDCGETLSLNWLLSYRCVTSSATIELRECSGNLVAYNGEVYDRDTTFTQTFQDVFGCDSMVMVTINFMPVQTATLAVSVCQGASFIYQGVEIPAGAQQTFQLSTVAGCDSLVTVQVAELPLLSSSLELRVCSGQTATYNGQSLLPGSQQTFRFTTSAGCDSLVTVSVTAYPTLSFDLATTTGCHGGDNGTVEVININGSSVPFLYAVDDQAFASHRLWTGQGEGSHVFKIQDENGCVFEQAFIIAFTPSIELALSHGLLPCNGTPIVISPTVLSGDDGQLAFLWENGATTPSLTVDAVGDYFFEVSNQCETVGQFITVLPEKEAAGELFFVPNVFSPNDDGVNEVLQVFPAADVELSDFKFQVFDRWGNQLFQTTAIDQGWDGWFHGREMNPAVYVWYMEADVMFCGQAYMVKDKGDVVLMR